MKTVYPDEKNVVLGENSVERKACINREINSLDITNLVLQLSRYQHEVPSSCNTTVYLSHTKMIFFKTLQTTRRSSDLCLVLILGGILRGKV